MKFVNVVWILDPWWSTAVTNVHCSAGLESFWWTAQKLLVTAEISTWLHGFFYIEPSLQKNSWWTKSKFKSYLMSLLMSYEMIFKKSCVCIDQWIFISDTTGKNTFLATQKLAIDPPIILVMHRKVCWLQRAMSSRTVALFWDREVDFYSCIKFSRVAALWIDSKISPTDKRSLLCALSRRLSTGDSHFHHHRWQIWSCRSEIYHSACTKIVLRGRPDTYQRVSFHLPAFLHFSKQEKRNCSFGKFV